MLRLTRFRPVMMAFATAVILGAPTRGHAIFEVLVSDGTKNWVITQDNSTAVGVSGQYTQVTNQSYDPANPGVITFSGLFGVFNIQSSFNATNPFYGDSNTSEVYSQQTTVDATAAGTLTIEVTSTGLTSPAGAPNPLVLTSGISDTTSPKVSHSLTFQSYADAANGAFSTGSGVTTTGLQGPFAGPTNDQYATTSFNRTSENDPFSITTVTQITFNSGNKGSPVGYTADTTVSTPAPGGIILALSGFPVLGFGTWLRRRRQR